MIFIDTCLIFWGILPRIAIGDGIQIGVLGGGGEVPNSFYIAELPFKSFHPFLLLKGGGYPRFLVGGTHIPLEGYLNSLQKNEGLNSIVHPFWGGRIPRGCLGVLGVCAGTMKTLNQSFILSNKLARSGHTQDINEKGKRRGEERRGEIDRERVCVCVWVG